MRAALLEEMPGDLVVQDARLTDIGPDEVLVRTVACGLCHSDLHYIEGKIPERTPVLLGHEAAGIVDAVGENVTEFTASEWPSNRRTSWPLTDSHKRAVLSAPAVVSPNRRG